MSDHTLGRISAPGIHFRSHRLTHGGIDASEVSAIASLTFLAVLALWWRWVGYQGHDEASYAAAAMDWVEHFPAVGATHWDLRYPLVLPTAVVIALFGPSVPALAVVNLAAFAAFLVGNYIGARHWFGRGPAAVLSVIGILLPQFLIQATYANPDLLEMSLAILSFWTLMFARERGGPRGLLLASGVLAGLGFLTRETSLMIMVLYGLMFLFRPAMPRRRYLWVALGFAVVFAAQTGYLSVRTGDPLYRSRISAKHDVVDRSSKLAEAEKSGHVIDSEGVLATNPLISPLAAVFVSQKYGLLFILAAPAYALLRRRRDLDRRVRSMVDWTGLGALVSFLFVALNGSILYVVPRYFMVSAAFAAVPVAILATLWWRDGRWRRGMATLAGIAFVASSLGLLYLENIHPVLAEERLAEFIANARQTVHVDPETARELHFLLVPGGLQDLATTAPPQPGDLVGIEDGVIDACLRDPRCTRRDAMAPFAPSADWIEVTRLEPSQRMIGDVLQRVGADRNIPADLWRKLVRPGTTALVYRVPGAEREASNR